MEKYILEALNVATELLVKSNRYVPEVVVEIKRQYETVIAFRATTETLSYNAIKELCSDLGYYSIPDSASATDVSEVEWEIVDNDLVVYNTWETVLRRMKKLGLDSQGKYMVVYQDGYESIIAEMNLYDTYDNGNLQPDSWYINELTKFIDIKCKSKDFDIYFIPKHHMFRQVSWETYPDDPGCGMASYALRVEDKATGVAYTQPYNKRS